MPVSQNLHITDTNSIPTLPIVLKSANIKIKTTAADLR